MPVSTAVEIEWGGETRTFALPNAQLRALQDKTGFGPLRLLHRIQSQDWFLDDLRETIRQGLIGGGKTPTQADSLVSEYVDGCPGLESVRPAQLILSAWLVGVDAATPQKKTPAAKKPKTKAARSTSGKSTVQPPR